MTTSIYTATVTLTQGQAAFTGTLSAFLARLRPGDQMRGPDGKAYYIASVAGNTGATLDVPYAGTTFTGDVTFANYSTAWVPASSLAWDIARAEEARARGFKMTSASSLAIGAGVKEFTGVETGLSILSGIRLRAASRANPSNWMVGICTYAGSTLTMTVEAGDHNGAGTFADWNINFAGEKGPQGIQGLQGPAGIGDVTAANAFGASGKVVVSDGAGKGVKASDWAVDTSGRLSYGVPTPGYQLDFVGADYLAMRVAAPNSPLIQFKGSYNAGAGAQLWQNSSGLFLFNINSTTNAFCVNPSGQMGLGTTSPSYQLHLSTDSAAKPGTNTWTIASDERLKQNIVAANLERCWEIVKTVPLKRYAWKDETYTADQVADRSKLGWIAQDVKPAFKNAVTPFKFTKAIDIPDGVEEYQEQETVAREVTREVNEIEIRNGVPVQVSKTITETVNDPVFDTVAVVDESGQPVLREVPGEVTTEVDEDGNETSRQAESTFEPVTHQVPRMVTKTRPKTKRETIDDCLSLNTDQIYAAMYGALQLAMSKIEALEAEVAELKAAT